MYTPTCRTDHIQILNITMTCGENTTNTQNWCCYNCGESWLEWEGVEVHLGADEFCDGYWLLKEGS